MPTQVISVHSNVHSGPAWKAPSHHDIRSSSAEAIIRVRRRVRRFSAHEHVLIVWVVGTLLPLILQLRSFVFLVFPHSVPAHLFVKDHIEFTTHDIESNCPMTGMVIADGWWNVYPTRYTDCGGEAGDLRVCHFVVQHLNIHGAYSIQANSSISTSECRGSASHAPTLHLYYYHGSVGYVAFFAGGDGIYCEDERTAYVEMQTLGTAEINGKKLELDTGADSKDPNHPAHRWSSWHLCFGLIWILYRAIVAHRSLVLCIDFGKRCDRLGKYIDMQTAAVFVQESARLTAHRATNLYRGMIVYAMLESLMGDLFLLISKKGISARVQLASICYNIAGQISLQFEMSERSPQLSDKAYRTIRRLLFNHETAFIGEIVSAIAMPHYVDVLNHSSFRNSIGSARAVSLYVWSLVGHMALIFGLLAVVFSVRAIGALLIVCLRYEDIRVLTAPNSVESALRGRLKVVFLSGYVWQNGHLFYSCKALAALGLQRTEPDIEDDREMLVQYQAEWWSSSRRLKQVVVARIVGGHTVEKCEPYPTRADTVFCDRILGASPGERTAIEG